MTDEPKHNSHETGLITCRAWSVLQSQPYVFDDVPLMLKRGKFRSWLEERVDTLAGLPGISVVYVPPRAVRCSSLVIGHTLTRRGGVILKHQVVAFVPERHRDAMTCELGTAHVFSSADVTAVGAAVVAALCASAASSAATLH